MIRMWYNSVHERIDLMGMNHIYCGNGKGKTTAAVGLAVRAAGAGMRVHIIQFLKASASSELNALASVPGITVERLEKDHGFAFMMNDQQKLETAQRHDEMLRNAKELISRSEIDMLILDEFTDAYELGLLDKKLADSVALRHYDCVELIITGRKPSPEYFSQADYISEIQSVRHPYENGCAARKGIEF